ncbi:MAG: C39 family peptidase [Candidatus Shapirobacteria bacterium]
MQSFLIILLSVILLSSCSRVTSTINKIETATETIIPKPTKILESGIPDYYLNKTAFIPQAPEKNWEQPWQDACEEAALLTVKYYFENITPDTKTLLSDYKNVLSQSAEKSINMSTMSQIANDLYGYKSTIIDNPDTDTIEKYLSQGNILIAPTNGKILYKENKYFRNGGPDYHNIVILGYDHNKKIFIVHDVGTQFGAYFKYSYKILLESLNDFQGPPRLLLLLK